MERQPERRPLLSGIQTISSRRGASSHHHNPFVVLCDPAATEETGDCIGAMLVYSGSFSAEIEVDQMGSTRLVMGIHSEGFSWHLAPGETFATPEVLLTFTHQGLTHLSHTYHRFLRRHIMRSPYAAAPRPVLLNNWEATYFHFDTESLLAIARQGAALGVELLVLDDGWFGHREDDRSSLGDWQVNETKLPGGLAPLIRQVEDMGLRFGLWVEPEMVSEDSDLYRAHPDWALRLPGRQPALSRSQLVLDFSRPEVVEHLYQCLSALLGQYPISYIKWDMNRNMTDVYSAALPPERQGEVTHRAMLGVYRLLERLTRAFPHVLFEGCAGGGGRFDAGMLAYFPQIWCSDNTDAIERLTIQYGTSFGYPVSAMGSHVSICPNHQTGRTTPLGTRGVVAMSGAFGYELDLNRLTAEEREEVRCQIAAYHRDQDLIHNGDYYRLLPPEGEVTAWQFAAPDGAEALVNVVVPHTRANARPIHFRLKGLDPEGVYELRRADYYGTTPEHPEVTPVGGRYSGSSLLYAGLTLPRIGGDYPSAQFHFVRISPEIRG
jgi:alpha-galactosidase